MAADEDYKRAVEKGSQLLDMLNSVNNTTAQNQAAPPTVTQSNFTAVEDLIKHGYTDELTVEESGKESLNRLKTAFQALQVNDEMALDGGNNILIEHQHLEDRKIDGVYYPCTLAPLTQICNPIDGVLVAFNNRTAPHSGKLKQPPVFVLPPLRHWSDVAYLQWLIASSGLALPQHAAPTIGSASAPVLLSSPAPITGPAPIKYIFRLTIQNVPTYSILNKIMAKHERHTYDIWPGMTFPINSQEGKAILGTPNGSGVAYLLAQHAAQLGNRTIEKVTAFYAENDRDIYRWPSLCFWIAQANPTS